MQATFERTFAARNQHLYTITSWGHGFAITVKSEEDGTDFYAQGDDAVDYIETWSEYGEQRLIDTLNDGGLLGGQE